MKRSQLKTAETRHRGVLPPTTPLENPISGWLCSGGGSNRPLRNGDRYAAACASVLHLRLARMSTYGAKEVRHTYKWDIKDDVPQCGDAKRWSTSQTNCTLRPLPGALDSVSRVTPRSDRIGSQT